MRRKTPRHSLRSWKPLKQEGFEGYDVDFRHGVATYYTADGDAIALEMHKIDVPIVPALDAAALRVAIQEAQQQVPRYTYRGFCRKSIRSRLRKLHRIAVGTAGAVHRAHG